MYQIVFSDVDGTLLNDQHQMTLLTKKAIIDLLTKKIPFVIVSARSPSGIFPILKENNFCCPIIAYSGALIMDDHHRVIYEQGMDTSFAISIIKELEQFNLTWNVYSFDNWYVKNPLDKRVQREEHIVKTKAKKITLDHLYNLPKVHKILCMCQPEELPEIEVYLKKRFTQCMIVRSSDILIEIMVY